MRFSTVVSVSIALASVVALPVANNENNALRLDIRAISDSQSSNFVKRGKKCNKTTSTAIANAESTPTTEIDEYQNIQATQDDYVPVKDTLTEATPTENQVASTTSKPLYITIPGLGSIDFSSLDLSKLNLKDMDLSNLITSIAQLLPGYSQDTTTTNGSAGEGSTPSLDNNQGGYNNSPTSGEYVDSTPALEDDSKDTLYSEDDISNTPTTGGSTDDNSTPSDYNSTPSNDTNETSTNTEGLKYPLPPRPTSTAGERNAVYMAPGMPPGTSTGLHPGDSNAVLGLDGSFMAEEDIAPYLVAAHNVIRGLHGVGNVTWNPEIAAYSRQHLQDCVFEHTKNLKYGENIAYHTNNPPEDMVLSGFYSNEMLGFDWNKPDGGNHRGMTGHMTAIVWDSVTEIGCAVKKCGMNSGSAKSLFLKCNYSPTPNIIGSYAKHVPGCLSGNDPIKMSQIIEAATGYTPEDPTTGKTVLGRKLYRNGRVKDESTDKNIREPLYKSGSNNPKSTSDTYGGY